MADDDSLGKDLQYIKIMTLEVCTDPEDACFGNHSHGCEPPPP